MRTCRPRMVVSPKDSFSRAYSSFPTRMYVVSSSLTTAANTFSLVRPRRSRSCRTRCRITANTVPNAIMRLNLAWSRVARYCG